MGNLAYQAAVFAALYALTGTGCCGIRVKRPREPGREIWIGERTLETRVLPGENPRPVRSGRTDIRMEFGEALSFDYENNSVRVPLRYWNSRKVTERVRAEVVVRQDVINEADLFEQEAQLESDPDFMRMRSEDFLGNKMAEAEYKDRILGKLKDERNESPQVFKQFRYVRQKKVTLQRDVEKTRNVEEEGRDPQADFSKAGYRLIVSAGCIDKEPWFSPDGSSMEFSLTDGCYIAENREGTRNKAEQSIGLSHIKKPCRKQAEKMLGNVEQRMTMLELCLKRDDDACSAKKRYEIPVFEYSDATTMERFVEEITRERFEQRIGEVQFHFYVRHGHPRRDSLIEVRHVEITPKNVPTPEQLAATCFDEGSKPFGIARDVLAGMYDFWDRKEPIREEDVDFMEASVFLPSTVNMLIDVAFGMPKVRRTVHFRKKEEMKDIVFK